ncbi:MAG: VWA domain-containing protein, partial [Oscillospiraceae bacterium]|nr:VWA domain-containing protein [Oscillospiraceae bacterium]
MGNRNTSFGRARKLTAWVMAFVMILSFFATPLAQVALAAPDGSGSEILSDGTDVGADAGATQSGEDSPEEKDQTPPESADSAEGGESQAPAGDDAAPAEGTEGTEGGEAAEGTAETEPVEDKAEPVEDKTEPAESETAPAESETEPVEAAEPAEDEAPADTVTVTARWYITSQNEETGALEDTLVFTKTLTGARGAAESVNVKALDPETEYSLLGYEVDDGRSGTVLGVYELLYDENKELAFYFAPANLLHLAPGDTVTVNIYRNVSGNAVAYTKTLTSSELSSLTTINVSDYFYAAGISASWALNTSPAGAAPAASVPVSDVLNGSVNFYMNAPTSGWNGREAVVHADNPAVTGQSVIVYTYAALKEAMQSTAFSYIEFGADLTAPATTSTALITIAANRTSTELVLNAKNYRFSSSQIGNGVIQVTSGSTNLAKITYRDWNVPAHFSSNGLLYVTGTRAGFTAVFDGLTFTGPQLVEFASDSPANRSVVFDGTRAPVAISMTRPAGAATTQEVVERGTGVVFVGQVSIARENIGSTTDAMFDAIESFLVQEAPAGASYATDVLINEKRASSRFANTASSFIVERNASFTYRGNRRFSTQGFTALSVGENGVFDVRTSGTIEESAGLVNVTGTLTVLDGATFVVVAENNGTSTYPVLYARGNVTISNPRKVLIYNSSTSTSASAGAVRFTNAMNLSFTGKNITTWAVAPAATVPETSVAYGTPTALFENENQDPYTLTGRANGANGSFGSVSASNYFNSAQPIDATNFTFTGRKVVGCLDFRPYAITYRIKNPDTGEESPAEGAFPEGYAPVQRGKAMVGTTVPYYAERVGSYRRLPDQGLGLLIGEGANEAVIYYRPDATLAPDAGLSKTVQRVSADTWEVTLEIDSETGTSPVDVDIMLLLDRSTSLSTAQRNTIATAGTQMMNTLASGANLTGTIRVGVIFFSSTEKTRFESRLIPIRVEGVTQETNLNTILQVLQLYRTAEETGGTHMDVPIVAAHYELYHPAETVEYYTPASPPTVYNPGSVKYMILLSDGSPVPASRGPLAIAAANEYKNHPGVHDDGKLITIGVGSGGVPFLDGLQNAG